MLGFDTTNVKDTRPKQRWRFRPRVFRIPSIFPRLVTPLIRTIFSKFGQSQRQWKFPRHPCYQCQTKQSPEYLLTLCFSLNFTLGCLLFFKSIFSSKIRYFEIQDGLRKWRQYARRWSHWHENCMLKKEVFWPFKHNRTIRINWKAYHLVRHNIIW